MARIPLPILLPALLSKQTPSGEYRLLAGRHSARWEGDPLWSDRYDVLLDSVRLASIFDGTAYPGRLSVSINGVRWLGRRPADHFDARYHDFIGSGDLAATFAQAVERCEAIHQDRGGWHSPAE